MQLSKNWKQIFSTRANVWLVIFATLLALWLANLIFDLQGKVLLSSAGGLARVVLVDNKGAALPEEITVEPGATIAVGWKSSFAKSCQSNGWTQITARSLTAVQVGPINQDQAITVTCVIGRGSATDSVLVHVNGGGEFTVTSPRKDELWKIGQRYIISWNLPASQQDQVNCGDCGAGQQVTITLDAPEPACLHQEPRCAIKRVAPYPIFDGPLAENTYAWTVPDNLPALYRGDQQITVTLGDKQLRALSEVFRIGTSDEAAGRAITVSSPNGGEVWDKTTPNHAITWIASSAVSKVDIGLTEDVCTSGGACTARMPRVISIASNIAATAGSYTLAKISDIPNGRYRATVSAADGSASDDSDAAFTIQSVSNCKPRDLGCDANPQPGDTSDTSGTVAVGQEFFLTRGQSAVIDATPAKVTVTYTDFIATACTQNLLADNCTGEVTVTVNGTKFMFNAAGQTQQITANLRLRLVNIKKGGLSVTFVAEQ